MVVFGLSNFPEIRGTATSAVNTTTVTVNCYCSEYACTYS